MPDILTKQTKDGANATVPLAGQSKRQPARRPTKKARLIRLLGGKTGVAVATISEKFGWQPHTTRAALSGLRKAGYGIVAEKPTGNKPVRYRITIQPDYGTVK